MSDLLILFGITVATAVLSISGGILLTVGKKTATFLRTYGPIVAAVVILSTVLGDILPDILEEERLSLLETILWMATGTLICLILGFLLGRVHKHGDKRSLHNKRQAYGMLAVDSIHALADGVVLGAAYAASPLTGLLAAVSTTAHEIPQEIGDFAIMLRSGMTKRRVIVLQLASSLVLVPAAIIAYYLGDALEPRLPMILALVGGFLIYIALGEIKVVVEDYRAKKKK